MHPEYVGVESIEARHRPHERSGKSQVIGASRRVDVPFVAMNWVDVIDGVRRGIKRANAV